MTIPLEKSFSSQISVSARKPKHYKKSTLYGLALTALTFGSPLTAGAGYTGGNWHEFSTVSMHFDRCATSAGKPTTFSYTYAGSCNRDADSNGNNVSVVDVIDSDSNLIGGYSSYESANYNKVTVRNSTIGSVFGGYTYVSDTGKSVSHNVVIIDNSKAGSILGGSARFDAVAVENAVYISDSDVFSVVGGLSGSGSLVAKANKVEISNSTVSNSATGGIATGDAVNNTVVVIDSSIGDELIGGDADDKASGNTVLLQNSQADWVYGGYAQKGATDNKVTISGDASRVNGEVFGGFNNRDDTPVVNNTVDISAGTVDGRVAGGGGRFADIANSNKTTLSGGWFKQDVYGGYASKIANNNIVEISGTARVDANVYGGGGYYSLDQALNNRVVILGSPNLINSTLHGGSLQGRGTQDGRSEGNVLEIHTKGITASNVKDFQEYHFILPADIAPNETVLTLTGGASNEKTDLTDAKVGVALKAGSHVLDAGDRVALIHNNNGVLTDAAIAGASLTGYQGISLRYQFDVSSDPKNLYATVSSGSPGGDPTDPDEPDPDPPVDPDTPDTPNSPDHQDSSTGSDSSNSSSGSGANVMDQTKAPVEGQVSMVALTLQGADMVAGQGLTRARTATAGTSDTVGFAALDGGKSRYKSGSHVDVNGANIMLGVARRSASNAGEMLTGVFFESGYGSYSSHNEFAGGQNVRGDGSSRYFGGGVLLRRDWADAEGGPYAEGSLRLGRVSGDWGSHDLIGAGGKVSASYDTSSTYYGAHLGLGYTRPLGDEMSIDLSAKYFWVHQNGSSAIIAGDPFEFAAVDSHRTQLAVRLNKDFNEQVVGYVSAAWQYEFDGQARATTYGLDTPSPTLQGSTGVFELGVDMKPTSKDSPWTFGLGVQAYAGMRQGLSGTAKVSYVF